MAALSLNATTVSAPKSFLFTRPAEKTKNMRYMLTVVVDRAGTRSKKIKSLYMFKQRNSTSHRLKREEGGRLGNLASFVPSFFC